MVVELINDEVGGAPERTSRGACLRLHMDERRRLARMSRVMRSRRDSGEDLFLTESVATAPGPR